MSLTNINDMTRIAIYCVTYNSYECVDKFVRSVVDAAQTPATPTDVTVYIADNTAEDIKLISTKAEGIRVVVFPFHKNIGYFGAINRMMSETDYKSYDFVIISNVDIELDKCSLNKLASDYGAGNSGRIGWIAPKIYSATERRDRNPKMTARYSLKKLKMLRFLFNHPVLYHLYRCTAYRRKKYQSHEAGEIYGGHGSFIILTKMYFEKCGIINYPVFLFGEEIYLAEQCRQQGLKVVYDPTIAVKDTEHASTGNMPSRFYCNCNAKALEYIMSAFY